MTARRFPCYVLLLVSASFGLSCGGGSSSNSSNVQQPADIYIAGYEVNNSNLNIAKYWKNGTPVILGAGTYGSDAWSVFVSGSDVYVAGREGSPNGDVAKYWKNGVGVPLATAAQNSVAIALSVFVDGSDVYVAGYDQGVAMYWANGARVALTDGTNPAQAWSVVVSGGDVYVAGWEYKTTQIDPTHLVTNPVAMYWKNGVPTELSDGLTFAVAQSMFLSGSDIYVAGNLCKGTNPGCDMAAYWKNGAPVVLSTQTPTAANSIFVSGPDVYVAGGDLTGNGNAIAELWKDGMLTQLSNGGITGANAVVVSGSDVYVAGADLNSNGNTVAGYWKNGLFVSVTDGTHFATSSALAVVQH